MGTTRRTTAMPFISVAGPRPARHAGEVAPG